MKKEKNLYYEKVKKYYYSVYDTEDFELNIASFESIEELTDFINKITNESYTNNYIKVSICKNYLIKDRYEIIRDKIEVLDNLKED